MTISQAATPGGKDSRYGNVPSGRTLTLADGRRFDVGDNWLQAQPPENQPR